MDGYTEEEQQIIDDAKKNGTYMKAPNGKKSNLSPKQWAQVRTENFKKWFGDWELALLYKQSINAWDDNNSKKKFVFAPSERASERLKDLLGHEITQLVVTDDSIRHIKKNHGSGEESRGQIDMTPEDIVVIPYLINNFDTMELNANFDDRMGNRAIEIRKRINGTSVIATIERGKNKDFLVTGFKLKRSDALDAQNGTPRPNVLNDSDIAKIKKEIDTIKDNAKNSSKIVDENGEPNISLSHFRKKKETRLFLRT